MYPVTLTLAIALYAAAAAASFVAFARAAARRNGAVERGLTAAGFLVHGVAIGVGCAEVGGHHLLTFSGATGLGAWIAAGALFLLQRVLRSAAPGVAILPLVVAFTFPGLFATAAAPAAGSVANLPSVRLHVTSAMAGVALLVLAAAMGALYLAQRRQLKGKRFGPLFRRLPALGTLDRAAKVLVLGAGAAFTFALASGGLARIAAWCSPWSWNAQRVGSVAAWLVFAGLAGAVALGVRGSRRAVLSLGGLALVVAFLVVGRQASADDPHARVVMSTALACAAKR